MIEDTIAAISTPIGSAGIGIVRLSGKKAVMIAESIFRGKKRKLTEAPAFSISYGHIINRNEEVIDEVLVSIMRAPKSFTAEDVVEINCHGGVVAVRKVMEIVLKEGARLAEPGEFSKRAFLNGRIDLAQAESIIDLINAKTEKSLQVAVGQLAGTLSENIRFMRSQLLELIAHIEAGIDFPEDNIEEITVTKIRKKLGEVLGDIRKLIETADTGKILREGIKTVIIGKPNVGKSSLLNALLREKRAIVTDVPGTTRDIIEEVVSIRGIPLKLVDTAGIRETEDYVEKMGVERSKEMFIGADLVLFMTDASTGLTEEDREIIKLMKNKNSLVIINKTDLKKQSDFLEIDFSEIKGFVGPKDIVEMSLVTGEGLEALEEKIEQLVYAGRVFVQDDVMITNIRHKNSLELVQHSLEEAVNTINADMPVDCVAIDLKAAWEALGEITGETVSEDILDQIFSQFCIGK
ncbi:tRNA uridine-5-carboxymethylaminomethyl(34) synthesis GTPase MnmE [Phosphitispora fastidiosa]|uniref:tRNA uridine-5-carboxymethylaminomethyl(34) synthesis GTPase MnmE n=1 Tax=Phosphitispora fastidiosa TaxID=2837202 RepID=UPI001E41869D|nr:tRNA modification GTPase [Phosphitispora fastidiosa]